MDSKGRASRELRVMVLSGMSVAVAPFVLLSLLMIRKLKPKLRFFFRHWNRRVQREIARWN